MDSVRECRGGAGKSAPSGFESLRKILAPLTDAATLAGHLGEPGWVVVDCRFQLTEPNAGYEAYSRGHIPGARYAHLDNDLASPIGPHDGRHPLPDPERFAQTLGSWGIDNSTNVVVYDDASGAIAARLWWLLRWLGHERVSVLDGGLGAWVAQGEALQSARPAWEKTHFSAAPANDQWIVDTAELTQCIASGSLLIDARSEERFRGISEPIDPVAGHVPGASNLPFSRLIAEDGTLLAAPQLKDRFDRVLDGCDTENVIAMCGSGVTACHLLLAMNAAGLKGGRLYAGSWSEWIRDGDREIATSPD